MNMIIEHDQRYIKIMHSVLLVIDKYRQFDTASCEAGGVLIGRENITNNNLIIEYASEPLACDRRTPYSFIRIDKGHVDFFNNLYNKNQEIYFYVGEWHTHPEEIPMYSIMDLLNWKRICRRIKGSHTQIHIIAGSDAICLWEFSSSTKTAKKIFTILWRDVLEYAEV